MGDVSLPQSRDYYRITWDNGLFSNNVDLEQIAPLIKHYGDESKFPDHAQHPTKIEHVVVSVEVRDLTEVFADKPRLATSLRQPAPWTDSSDDCECGDAKHEHSAKYSGCRWCKCVMLWDD